MLQPSRDIHCHVKNCKKTRYLKILTIILISLMHYQHDRRLTHTPVSTCESFSSTQSLMVITHCESD